MVNGSLVQTGKSQTSATVINKTRPHHISMDQKSNSVKNNILGNLRSKSKGSDYILSQIKKLDSEKSEKTAIQYQRRDKSLEQSPNISKIINVRPSSAALSGSFSQSSQDKSFLKILKLHSNDE